MAETILIPFTPKANGKGIGTTNGKTDETTLKELGISEADLEEFVRTNIASLFPTSDENLLIIGQQVRNKSAGRADLVAIDGNGDVVLIELKRDQSGITSRREPFEFQAVRYAANYALIKTPQEIVDRLFASYIEKHKNSEQYKSQISKGFTASEIASRYLREFLKENKAEQRVNQRQRIVLVASSFDDQTLSACAWLSRNGVDIRCVKISPIKFESLHFFQIEQIIPPPSLESFYVEIPVNSDNGKSYVSDDASTRRMLPRMSKTIRVETAVSGGQTRN